MTLYPLGDFCRKAYQFNQAYLRARATGEFRAPKKGEWYLSGAIITAYQAPNDLSTSYHIAEIVLVERKPVEVVQQVIE